MTNLVEAPTACLGSFQQEHLSLPREVLISVMKKHQRYFPVKAANGSLLPFFIAVRNGDHENLETVIDGNEQVIRARFTDAAFFIREDLKHTLEDYLPRLDTLTFQFKLGSMLDKTRRIQKLVPELFSDLSSDESLMPVVQRAALLAKPTLSPTWSLK